MVKFRYTGKQPILVEHKFIYPGEVHRVTPAQWAVLMARHGATLTRLDQAGVAAKEPFAPSVGDDHPHGPQTATDESAAAVNLNNQTEKKSRKRGKAG